MTVRWHQANLHIGKQVLRIERQFVIHQKLHKKVPVHKRKRGGGKKQTVNKIQQWELLDAMYVFFYIRYVGKQGDLSQWEGVQELDQVRIAVHSGSVVAVVHYVERNVSASVDGGHFGIA